MKRVKVKKKTSSLASFYEALLQENKDLRVQVAHTEDEITILKQRNTTLEYENKRLQEEITQLKNKYIRVSKVTSRSGSRIAYRTAKQIVETEYNWPLINTGISSYYGSRTMNGTTKLHTGIDIPCSLNTDIEAVDNGTVIFAGWSNGYGYYIQIDHGAEIISAYAHLNSLSVNVGDNVIKGQTIGKSGSTGNSTGPHLHLEFIVNGNFYNPLTFYQDS